MFLCLLLLDNFFPRANFLTADGSRSTPSDRYTIVTHEKFIATLLQFQYGPYASRYTITCAGMQTGPSILRKGLMCEIREKNHNGSREPTYVSATLINFKLLIGFM